MPTTNPSPDEILEAMKDYKCDIKVLSQPQRIGHENGKTWKTTGFGSWGENGGLIGAMMHHTGDAIAATKSRPIPGWDWFVNASDPQTQQPWPGAPACNQIIGPYPGNNYILCGRTAMHSGPGRENLGLGIANDMANYRMWGIEIVSQGEVKDFNDYQIEQACRSLAALAELCGWPDNGKTIINHRDWAGYRGKRDTLYSRNFWAKGMKKYLDGGSTSSSSGNGNGNGNGKGKGKGDDDDKKKNNIPDVALVTRVGKTAIGKSQVVGTPQTGRFAVINLTNETVFLSDGESSIIDRSNSGLFYINSNAIEAGDPVELIRSTGIKNASNELSIESTWVQDPDTAASVVNIITDSLNIHYIRVIVQVFGNPLIQIGDIIQIKSLVYKLDIANSDYFIVSRVNHTFSSTGMTTQLELRPIKETFKMI